MVEQYHQRTLTGKHPVIDWYERHSLEYALTEKRLADTKAKFMSAPLHEAVEMHNLAFIQTVISQQNPVAIYQPALNRYFKGASMRDAFQPVNYSGQKIGWIAETLGREDRIEQGVKMLRDSRVKDYCEFARTHFKGVSFIKAPFTAAMLGFTSVMCIDTNVAQLTGTDARSIKSWDTYWSICDDICEAYQKLDTDPFVIQWALFDYQRGMHEPHREWFEAVGTWHELARNYY